MSVVSGSGACRMTLGTLASRYGYELVPPSSEGVTVTSLADEVDSVIPGSLYVPAGSVNMERLECWGSAMTRVWPRWLRN